MMNFLVNAGLIWLATAGLAMLTSMAIDIALNVVERIRDWG